MGMFRKLLMVATMQSQQGGETDDMTEVYAYAQSVGITPQQVDAALADKPAIIKEKLIAWKYLLHSLVDTGYTPWLKGDGVAYIETDITPVPLSYVEAKFVINKSSGAIICGARDEVSSSYSTAQSCIIYFYARKLSLDWASGKKEYTSAFPKGTVVQLYEEPGHAIVNGVEYNYANVASRPTIVSPLFIFTRSDQGEASLGEIYNGKLSYIKFSGSRNSVAVTGHFVPYFDNGTYGMLDLVTGSFYGSAVPNGLFTYILEDSNGNAVNIT